MGTGFIIEFHATPHQSTSRLISYYLTLYIDSVFLRKIASLTLISRSKPAMF